MTYAAAEDVSSRSTKIKLHGPADFEGMRKAGRLTAECLDMLVERVGVGTTTEEIDRWVIEFARDRQSVPATIGTPSALSARTRR